MKRLLGILFAVTCMVNAFAAPQTPRHSKILYVKQNIYNDVVCTYAAITQPGVIGNSNRVDNIDLMRQDMGAQFIQNGKACPHAGSSTMPTNTDFPAIARVNYEALKSRLEELYQAEELMRTTYSKSSSECYYDETCNNYDFKTYINSMYSNNSIYLLAIKVRERATDYSTLNEESASVATDYNMNNTAEAQAFKDSIQAYLAANKISTAFVDIETEFTIGTRVKRAAATLTIDMNDTSSTKGSYTGATVINPPNPPAGTPAYRNSINITYTTASQYPDFYNLNTTQLNDRESSYGKIEWSVPTPIDPILAGSSIDVNGVYDPSFPGTQPIKSLSNPSAPVTTDKEMRSIQNIYPAQEPNTIKCILLGAEGCNTNAESVQSIMRKNNARTGTFTFYGRWELKPRIVGGKVQSDPPDIKIEETLHGLEYDVCKPVKFWNNLTVNYTVQRYRWVYDVMLDPIQGFKYRLAGNAIMDREVVANTPTTYNSSGLLLFGRDLKSTDYVERTLMQDKAIIDPTKWTTSHDSVVASKPFTPPGTGQPVISWAPAMTAYAATVIYRASDLPNGSYPYIDAQARTVHFNCYAINEDTIATYYAKQCAAGSGTGSGTGTGFMSGFKDDINSSNSWLKIKLDKNKSNVIKNNNTTSSFVKTQFTTGTSGEGPGTGTAGLSDECIMPGTISITPGNNNGDTCTISYIYHSEAIDGKVISKSEALPNNACTESCEIGETPSPICPRPRSQSDTPGTGE